MVVDLLISLCIVEHVHAVGVDIPQVTGGTDDVVYCGVNVLVGG